MLLCNKRATGMSPVNQTARGPDKVACEHCSKSQTHLYSPRTMPRTEAQTEAQTKQVRQIEQERAVSPAFKYACQAKVAGSTCARGASG